MSDLSRIKGVGVACIVWYASPCRLFGSALELQKLFDSCLDDNELLSLGVSWPEYAEAADDLGIDVLRYVALSRRSPCALIYVTCIQLIEYLRPRDSPH